MPLPLSTPGHGATGGPDFTWFFYGSSLDREASRNPYFQLKDAASFVAYRMRPRT